MNKDNKNLEQNIQDVSNDEQIISKQDVNLELPKTKQPVYIRTLNVFVNPARRRYEKHYKESKKHLVIDLIFVILILLLIAGNIVLMTKSFPIENLEIKINRPQENDSTKVIEPISDTKLVLNSSVEYFNQDGDQLGTGPWPPVIEQTSSLRVFVSLKPGAHSVSDIVFKIQLPKNITWTDNFVVDSGNALTYDIDNNLIYWQIDQLAINQKANANFEIQITPTAQDLGNKLKLVNSISVSATDMLTKNEVSQTSGSLYSPVVE